MEAWKEARLHGLTKWANDQVNIDHEPDFVIKELIVYQNERDRLQKVGRILRRDKANRRSRFFRGNSILEDYSGR
jgi:hypothetical protein